MVVKRMFGQSDLHPGELETGASIVEEMVYVRYEEPQQEWIDVQP